MLQAFRFFVQNEFLADWVSGKTDLIFPEAPKPGGEGGLTCFRGAGMREFSSVPGQVRGIGSFAAQSFSSRS